MKIKNIVFDVGGVLADPKSGHWFITNNFYNILDKKKVDENRMKDSLRKYMYLQTQEPKTEQEEHKMFTDYYYNVLKEIEYPNLTIDIAEQIADDCVYNDDKFIFYEDVTESLKELSESHDLYIISNGWPSSLRVLKNMNVSDYFKGIIISSMYSTIKEETLFDVFFKEYPNVNPMESLYIDDRNHVLNKAKGYKFNLTLMDRKHKINDSEYKVINNLKDINKLL